VEWWERQTERRRIRYFVERRLHGADTPQSARLSLFARVRSIATLFLLMFGSRVTK
jgi:hypothetical protein